MPPNKLNCDLASKTGTLYDSLGLNCNGETRVHGWFFNGLLTLDMSRGAKGAKRPLESPLGGGVRLQYCSFR